jgi:hypothetical protein
LRVNAIACFVTLGSVRLGPGPLIHANLNGEMNAERTNSVTRLENML